MGKLLSNRRRFLKTSTGIFVPAVTGLVRAQPFTLNDPAFLAATRPKAAAASCTLKDSFQPTLTGTYSIGQFVNALKRGGSFTPTSSYTVCKAVCKLAKVGTGGSGTMQAFIYSDSANLPVSIIGSGSSVYNMNTAPASDADFTFDNMSASVTSGTAYFLVLVASTNDSSNYVNWSRGAGGASDYRATWDGSSWSSSAFVLFRMDIYGQ